MIFKSSLLAVKGKMFQIGHYLQVVWRIVKPVAVNMSLLSSIGRWR